MNNFNIKEFFKYTSLNILGMVGVSLYVLADTFFIAQAFGSNGIVSLNLTIPVYCLMSAIGLMVGIGGSTKFNILNSIDQKEEAYNMFSSSIKIGFLISMLFVVVGVFFSERFSYILGSNSETIRNTNIYLKTIMIFAPGFILNNIFTVFSRNDGYPRLSMTAMLVGSFVNIILDYIFIFILNLGMFGAAFATGLSAVLSISIVGFYYIFIKKKILFIKEKIHYHQFKSIFKLGFPTLIIEISAAILTAAFNLITLQISGNQGAAAYGIVGNISFVSFAVLNGLSGGTQPLFGRSYGKKDKTALKQVLTMGIISGIFLALLIYFVVNINAYGLAHAFAEVGNFDVINMSVEGMRIYFFGFLFSSVNMICIMFMTSIEKIRNAFLISILRGILLSLPILIILGESFGMKGVWASYIVTEFITMIIAVLLVRKNLKYSKI